MVASPVSLLFVISNILSTPRINAIPSLGTPTDSKIITNIIIPGTAAVPIEAKTAVKIIVDCA